MFKHVLVPLDRSPESEQALEVAVTIALAADATLELVLVREQPLLTELPYPLPIADRHDDEAYLKSVARRISLAGLASTTCVIPDGDAAEQICAQSRRDDIDLIVMTSHFRTGLARAWSGSVADKVVRDSGLPVLMIRITDRRPATVLMPVGFHRILVPLDGSAAAAAILPSVRALAKCNHSEVILLRIVEPPSIALPALTTSGTTAELGMAFSQENFDIVEQTTRHLLSTATDELDSSAAQLRAAGVRNVSWFVEKHDKVADGILGFAAAHAVDFIAMCTHGRGASRLLFGGVADGVLRNSRLPLLLQCPERELADLPHVTAASVESQLSCVVA